MPFSIAAGSDCIYATQGFRTPRDSLHTKQVAMHNLHIGNGWVNDETLSALYPSSITGDAIPVSSMLVYPGIYIEYQLPRLLLLKILQSGNTRTMHLHMFASARIKRLQLY